MTIKAKDVMSQPVAVLYEDRNLEEAALLMLDKRVSGLPIISSKGNIVGIITESDFSAKRHTAPLSRIFAPSLFGEWMTKPELEKAYEEARSIKVKEIMSKPVITATEDEHLSDVVVKLLENNIRRVPVVRSEKPVGIISRHDLLKLVAGKMKSRDWS